MLARALVLLFVIGLAAPVPAWGQGLGLGARVGTLGLGGELALGLSERIVVRGGVGFVPFEPGRTFSDVDVSLSLPTVYNVGVDLYLNRAMRIGGGVLFQSQDVEVNGSFDTSQDIGGSTFEPAELGVLTGVLDSRDRAPYVLIGFGPHTAAGAGLFLDLGFVYLGDPAVRLGATGGTLSDGVDPLRSALDQEAAEFEDDMPGYMKFWPIISLGFRMGAR
jgi:hypothetical protein